MKVGSEICAQKRKTPAIAGYSHKLNIVIPSGEPAQFAGAWWRDQGSISNDSKTRLALP